MPTFRENELALGLQQGEASDSRRAPINQLFRYILTADVKSSFQREFHF